MKVRADFYASTISFVRKLLLPMWIERKYCYKSMFAVIFPQHKMQDDDGSEEGYVNEDLGPPPKGASVKEERKNSGESDEEGYFNDDMGPPDKVHSSV